ncbi:ADP-ribose glycohydrolase MACROD1-like [Carassius carassius]|uniref:ADP-ribose glycohydrolase MACROD1-like n=1 Tax=Carassius carassius TaxID=217509 RepID=UPI002868A489|nr:ADP-ribose glycohydrolase MACROD1-like [Carassius carassius]
MSARPELNLDSESSDWKEAKKKLCSMDKEKRREMYRIDLIPLQKISICSPSGDSSCKPRYKVSEELNKKISLFSGDITKLEINAVANTANKTLLGGEGDIIHNVGPIVHEREMRNCYYNCLQTATKNHLQTVAFPFISTGVYSRAITAISPDQAVEVALRTVREYLEQKPREGLDWVIFCVFLKSDKELYETVLPACFPQAVYRQTHNPRFCQLNGARYHSQPCHFILVLCRSL